MFYLKLVRTNANLSQSQIAEMAGITPLAVLRYEQGLLENLSPKLAAVIAELADVPLAVVHDEYEDDRRIQRVSQTNIFRNPPSLELRPDEHPFETFRKLITRRAVGTESRMAFCKLLALHPAVVAEYDKGKCKHMPAMIKEALLAASCPEKFIETLDSYGEIYYDRHS